MAKLTFHAPSLKHLAWKTSKMQYKFEHLNASRDLIKSVQFEISKTQAIKPNGFFKLMRTRIKLLAQPKSMRSIIDATQREQRHGLT